ncbi:MAG TPA: hypothetical protein VF929_01495, partial [Gemmatimonadaceae bacterium]
MLLAAAIILAVSAIGAAVYALRMARRSGRDLALAHARLARMDATLPSTDDDVVVGAEALRRDVRVSFEAREVAQDRTMLASLLMDFRDVTGAEEAIFWRWKPDRDALAPAVWSSDGDRPRHFDVAEWGPLVQWSAETGVVQTVGKDDLVHVAAACVRQDDELLG